MENDSLGEACPEKFETTDDFLKQQRNNSRRYNAETGLPNPIKFGEITEIFIDMGKKKRGKRGGNHGKDWKFSQNAENLGFSSKISLTKFFPDKLFTT